MEFPVSAGLTVDACKDGFSITRQQKQPMSETPPFECDRPEFLLDEYFTASP